MVTGPRRLCARIAVAAIVAASLVGSTAGVLWSHPLHTTMTEVSIGPTGDVELRLRAFVDDFSAAVSGTRAAPRPPIVTPSDSAIARYLTAAVLLTDGAGTRLSLEVTGVRRDADVIRVTLRAPRVHSLAGARLTNAVLFERYDDQVNIVQIIVGGRRQTVLFTKREGRVAKAV